MDLTTYERLVKTENAARKYLLGFCFENHQRFCPRCKGKKLYRLADDRRRCSSCRYTFHDFSGRWINQGNLTAGQWLRLIKLFELELSVRKISQQLRLSYNAAYKAVHTIRDAILVHSTDGEVSLSGEVEVDESYFGGKRKGKRGRGAAGKVPVFGILEREGRVFVEVLPSTRAKDVLALTVKKVRRGSIVYTDRYKSYDALMFCGYRHLRVDHGKYFSRGRVYINGLEGFWSYAKERIMKYHGVSPERFPFYLKELEFRYNHRKTDLFPLITRGAKT
ncbi:MAG: DDE Tnp IS1595 protein [Actinobacteria bacterium]|nr:DDE Tnp IS1595 protein [Actinomycetota bacterium]